MLKYLRDFYLQKTLLCLLINAKGIDSKKIMFKPNLFCYQGLISLFIIVIIVRHWLTPYFLLGGIRCLPVLAKVLGYHGSSSSALLSRLLRQKLQRQPADGLRFKLLERINNSVGAEQQSPTCLSTAYDLLGRAEWFQYIHPEIISRPGMAAHLASNLMMHL